MAALYRLRGATLIAAAVALAVAQAGDLRPHCPTDALRADDDAVGDNLGLALLQGRGFSPRRPSPPVPANATAGPPAGEARNASVAPQSATEPKPERAARSSPQPIAAAAPAAAAARPLLLRQAAEPGNATEEPVAAAICWRPRTWFRTGGNHYFERQDYWKTMTCDAEPGNWVIGRPTRGFNRKMGLCGTALIFIVLIILLQVEGGPPSKLQQRSPAVEKGSASKELPLITMQELKAHSTPHDMWILVDGLVCDVSDFANDHPGGLDVLLERAGGDASGAFREVGHSGFAVESMRNMAIGVIAQESDTPAEAKADKHAAGPRLLQGTILGRLFTKEDNYNLHKILGFTCLAQYLARIVIWIAALAPEGYGPSGIRADVPCLIGAWLAGLLQLSSFLFHVPRNRPTSGPMIWQEWRTHNLIFVYRHLLHFTYAWIVLRSGMDIGAGSYLVLCLANVNLLLQLYLVDEATKWLREDSHETLTTTMPYWERCPLWVEEYFKTWFIVGQLQASGLAAAGTMQLDILFLVMMPFQLYSFLMTLVRKGLISSRTCLVVYYWSLVQVYWCAICQANVLIMVSGLVPVLLMLGTKLTGFNKYAMWFGVMIPNHLNAWGILRDSYAVTVATAVVLWILFGLLMKLFTRIPVFTSRHSRYVEARPKHLYLVSREDLSSTLVLLRFQFPWFFRAQGFSSGLSPGQHIRLLCENPSQGMSTWNGRNNMEAGRQVLSRSYTPVSSSSSPTVDFIVKRYPANPREGFADGGRGSRFLVETLQLGDDVWLSGPHGGKIYRGNGVFMVGKRQIRVRACCALVGGSGITPALSILRQCRSEARAQQLRYGRMPRAGELLEEVSILHVNHSSSEALPSAVYEPPDEKGLKPSCQVVNLSTGDQVAKEVRGKRIKESLQTAFPKPADDVIVIVCGPKAFVDKLCIPMLQQMGHRNVVTMW